MEIRELYFGYDTRPVLKNLTLTIRPEEITVILGANGSGKSTLFQLLTKNLTPQGGTILLDGQDIRRIKPKYYATQVAAVHQQNKLYSDITVKQLISYGRSPYKKFLQTKSQEDATIIQKALDTMDLNAVQDTPVINLSGGQRQRVWIAMALVQDTNYLLLDEPTTYLDIRYQIEILEHIYRLNQEEKKTIVMVLHDVNQAINYAHTIVGLKDGHILFQGPPQDVITTANIEALLDIRLKVETYDDLPVVIAPKKGEVR